MQVVTRGGVDDYRWELVWDLSELGFRLGVRKERGVLFRRDEIPVQAWLPITALTEGLGGSDGTGFLLYGTVPSHATRVDFVGDMLGDVLVSVSPMLDPGLPAGLAVFVRQFESREIFPRGVEVYDHDGLLGRVATSRPADDGARREVLSTFADEGLHWDVTLSDYEGVTYLQIWVPGEGGGGSDVGPLPVGVDAKVSCVADGDNDWGIILEARDPSLPATLVVDEQREIPLRHITEFDGVYYITQRVRGPRPDKAYIRVDIADPDGRLWLTLPPIPPKWFPPEAPDEHDMSGT